jgi:hypothetical protein
MVASITNKPTNGIDVHRLNSIGLMGFPITFDTFVRLRTGSALFALGDKSVRVMLFVTSQYKSTDTRGIAQAYMI